MPELAGLAEAAVVALGRELVGERMHPHLPRTLRGVLALGRAAVQASGLGQEPSYSLVEAVQHVIAALQEMVGQPGVLLQLQGLDQKLVGQALLISPLWKTGLAAAAHFAV